MKDNPIRMVVTDLDGTYLRSDKHISEYTRRITQAVREKGIYFIIATARPVRAVKQWLPWVEYDMGVFHNGAVIHDSAHAIGHIGVEQPRGVLQHLLKVRPDLHLAAEADDVLYANFNPRHIWPSAEYVYTPDFSALPDGPADKLIAEAHTKEAAAEIGALLPNQLYAQLAENVIAMIMNRSATKVNGVRLLARQLGIADSEIAAFGDDYNDMEMLRTFGRGIAVANALPEVQAAASETCLFNDCDGVARWMEAHLL